MNKINDKSLTKWMIGDKEVLKQVINKKVVYEKQSGLPGGLYTDTTYTTFATLPNGNLGTWTNLKAAYPNAFSIANTLKGNSSASYFPSNLTGAFVIPTTISTIGENAFRGCDSLTSILIPETVTIIENLAFRHCAGLASIVVDSNNTVYDSRNNCNAIIEIATNKLIAGCKNTIIPNDVLIIGNNAFYGCTQMTNVVIPNSVTLIDNEAFSTCLSLSSVTIGSSVTTIGISAFYQCPFTSITIPNSVRIIKDSAFQNCRYLRNLTLGTGLQAIGVYSFDNCDDLRGDLIFPNNFMTLGNQAFRNCSKLTSVTIPSVTVNIESLAFQNCTSLTTVYCYLTSSLQKADTPYLSWFNGCSSSLVIHASSTLNATTSKTAFGAYWNGYNEYGTTLTTYYDL